MTDSQKYLDENTVTGRLRRFGKNVSRFTNHASVEEQQTLLRLLEDQQLPELLETWSHRNRRESPRKPCSLPVSYTIEDVLFTDVISNIGADGVFMETSSILSVGHVGQQVALKILPPSQEEPIAVNCEIAWRDAGRVGLKFTETSNELHEMIESL